MEAAKGTGVMDSGAAVPEKATAGRGGILDVLTGGASANGGNGNGGAPAGKTGGAAAPAASPSNAALPPSRAPALRVPSDCRVNVVCLPAHDEAA